MELNEYFSKRRICALITLIIMLLNTFSPYGVLFNKSYAATPEAGKAYFKMSIMQPGDPDADDDDGTYYYYFDYINGNVDTPDESQSRAIVINLSIEGCSSVNAGDINFKWNTDKMVAAQVTKKTRNGTPYLEVATDYTNSNRFKDADFGITDWAMPIYETLDADAGTLRFGRYNINRRFQKPYIYASRNNSWNILVFTKRWSNNK